jgi:hypothetical protein
MGAPFFHNEKITESITKNKLLSLNLEKRTLTNIYNTRPAWLDNAHSTLDKAVAAAYEWNDYTPEMGDETILGRLLALNLERFGCLTTTANQRDHSPSAAVS